MLTEEHKKQRVACALTFLMRYHKEGDGMLSHTVTGFSALPTPKEVPWWQAI